LGAGFGVAIGGSILFNTLQSILGPEKATKLRKMPAIVRLPVPNQVSIDALSKSIKTVFYFPIAIACLMFITAFFIKEYRIISKKS
jgi:hypothetical protein